MVKHGCQYGFLVVVVGKTNFGTVIGNLAVQWTTQGDMMNQSKTKTLPLIKAKWRKTCQKSDQVQEVPWGVRKHLDSHASSSGGIIFRSPERR